MGFFDKEKLDSLKKQAKEAKASMDAHKARHDAAKAYQKERKAKFEGKALQPVGVIPNGSDVVLRLDPDTQIFSINYTKTISVKLPYDRVLGFRMECITETVSNQTAKLVGMALSSGILGGGFMGLAGRMAGSVVGNLKRKQGLWVGTLIYRDKTGDTQELSFAGCKIDIEGDETPYKYPEYSSFEEIVNGIALNANQDLMEL